MRGLPVRRSLAMAGLAAVAALALAAAACGDDDNTTTPAASAAATKGAENSSPAAGSIPADVGKNDSAKLTGSGASFPQDVYTTWASLYQKVAKDVELNYTGGGSGKGISDITAGNVQLAASDAPMSADERSKAPDVVHIPTVIGAVVMTYNLSGVTVPLKLDGATISKIYKGTITKWNDPAIKALNSGVNLPGADIKIVFRSDSSGTSFIFTDYLSKTAPSDGWTATKQPNFSTVAGAQGGAQSPGVATLVKNTPNSIGYVELSYATANKLPFADVKNRSGNFVTASPESVSKAADGVTLGEDYPPGTSIVESSGAQAYPISSFTYMLVYKSTGKCSDQTPIADFLWWTYHDKDAQSIVAQLGFAPLPASVLSKVEASLKALKCDNGAKSSLRASS